jgi:hypothetical protein
MFFLRAKESIKRNLIFANMSVDVQRDFTTGKWQFGKRWHGNGDVIADAHSVDNHLIRVADDELSAKMGNHEGIVLRHRKCLTRHGEVATHNE